MAEGLMIRLTHTGKTVSPAAPTPILIADVLAATDGPAGYRKAGPVYVPPTGFVQMVYSTTVATSFEAGNIRQFLQQGYITAAFHAGDAFGDLVAQTIRVPFLISPGNTIREIMWFPYAIKVLEVQAYIESAALTAGTYTLAVNHGPDLGLVNMLSTPTSDLTALVAQTITPIPLTVTTANLDLVANTRIVIDVDSSLGDLVAAGLFVSITFGLR